VTVSMDPSALRGVGDRLVAMAGRVRPSGGVAGGGAAAAAVAQALARADAAAGAGAAALADLGGVFESTAEQAVSVDRFSPR
jgi:hypothetical protein